ncbi:AsnC family protein [Micromonospora sp. WMMC273]|uniref:AsnC family protein n=1 Tax=Micromonospora sp. WMMC273 TaxID=3015157 RepID=UPI0022B748DA|nr:AsnC family protein [Micromonospora sp. WMMC273]MCZ7478917.1 AsnC family protein [Micromonospora sp. WMMC273]
MTLRVPAGHREVDPQDATLLRAMREVGDPRLSATLRTAWWRGWGGRALGRAVGLSETSVRARVAKPDTGDGLRIKDPPLRPSDAGRAAGPVEVTAQAAVELRHLYEQARQVRARTAQDSPLRAAADRLDVLLDGYVHDGVPVAELAAHVGVEEAVVRARVARYRRPRPAAPKPDTGRVARRTVVLSPELIAELRRLCEDGAKVRHHTPPGHPYRAAAEQFVELAEECVREGVSARRLAGHLGISPGHLQLRLSRYRRDRNLPRKSPPGG